MSYYSDRYGGYDDEDEEPPTCDDCGMDLYIGEHATWCKHAPTRWQRLRKALHERWLRFYYTPVSIATLHGKLKRCLKRKANRALDDDIPF